MIGSRKATAQPIVLSFRADGPYWSDLIHLLAYPPGVSYIWSFRYNAGRVQADLQDELASAGSRNALAGTSILIAARFYTASANDRLLPIRSATLTHVDISAGIYSFYFRLGLPIRFDKAKDLYGSSTQTARDVELLAFREDVDLPIPIAASEDLVGLCWKSFAELIDTCQKHRNSCEG